ncbi:MAG: hypothetical protein IJ215_03470 [Clostridia bacterium]|nr:hypothetical protein [Clostridia bacterium]
MCKGRENLFVSRMESCLEETIGKGYLGKPCAKRIKPLIQDFYEKCVHYVEMWFGTDVCWHFEGIFDITKYLAANTRDYQKLSDADFESLKKIFSELDSLLEETDNTAWACRTNLNCDRMIDFRYKISCLSEMICKNMAGMHDSEEDHQHYRDGMIFQNYENLWKVIHRVNTDWLELCHRGFSLKLFYSFWDSFQYDRQNGTEKLEDEKFQMFMDVLDGKMKVVPVYQYMPISYQVVDKEFEGHIVTETEYQNNYQTYCMQSGNMNGDAC